MRSKESKRAVIKQKPIAVFWIALSFLLIWSPAFAAVPINGEALLGLDGFDKAMVKFIEKHKIPGGSLAVSYKGRLILTKGYGYADFSGLEKVPVHPRNRFRLASLSKPLTATAIMSLMQEGRLSLDSKVVPLLQGNPPHKIRDKRLEQISIQHLLEHRGGHDKQASGDPMFSSQSPCPGNLSSYFRERLDFTPGEKYAYSNLGYCLLGRVVERISGKPYEVFIKERILQPVGANSLEIGDSKEIKPDEVCYFQDPSESKQSPHGRYDMKALDSCGGWIGSSVDYLKFLTSLDGQRKPGLLKPETFKIMLTMPDAIINQKWPEYYAKGFHVRKLFDGGLNFWHPGSLAGTLNLAVRASNGYGWVVLLNRRPPDWGRVRHEMDQELWKASGEVKETPTGDLFAKF